MCHYVVINGFDLECNFDIGYLSNIMSKQCSVKNLDITTPNQEVTSINGHSDNYYQNIKILKILSQTVHFLPNGIASLLTHVEAIEIFNSSLKSITRSDIEPFKSLKNLYIHSNDLETLDSDLFESNREMRNIHFNQNKLKFIGKDLLTPLEKLDRAFFKDNICLNKSAFGPIQLKNLKAEIAIKCSE